MHFLVPSFLSLSNACQLLFCDCLTFRYWLLVKRKIRNTTNTQKFLDAHYPLNGKFEIQQTDKRKISSMPAIGKWCIYESPFFGWKMCRIVSVPSLLIITNSSCCCLVNCHILVELIKILKFKTKYPILQLLQKIIVFSIHKLFEDLMTFQQSLLQFQTTSLSK